MMLSRMADALYWMARDLERADNAARLVEINLSHLVEAEESTPIAAQWQPFLDISASTELFRQLYGVVPATKENVVPFLTQEKSNPNALLNILRRARENARVVRDCISKEMWECVNHLWLSVSERLRTPLSPDRAPALYDHLRKEVARFHGITASTMMEGEAYGYYRMGLFMERADMTARILDVKYYILLPDVDDVGSALDYYQWMALLKSLSGFEAFRRLHHAGLRPIDVAEFVILNAEFPRSLRFCIDRMGGCLKQFGYEPAESAAYKAWADLRETLAEQTAESIFQQGLHEFLTGFLARLAEVNAALQKDYHEAHLGDRVALLD
jgi:uncharacterized alpha-E superfamily protein